MESLNARDIARRYRKAKDSRATWEAHWRQCYEFALPQRSPAALEGRPGERQRDSLFDATAPDAVDQLAASLLAQLTPPWGRWFALVAGIDATEEDRRDLATELERATAALQSHFDRSNFAVEVHQCYLDLVTAGTSSLMFEEARTGETSAFRFTAVPLSEAVLDEGASGRLDTTYRRTLLTRPQVLDRYPSARRLSLPTIDSDPQFENRTAVIEAVVPEGSAHRYLAVADSEHAPSGDPTVLAEGRFTSSPFINFRWLKAPGEVYGRSPVMKALPDIKTANKVVELVLKNASIAVTGIWQADDDGVLNPATVQLVPGTIIPKAVGSRGLTPLEAPGRFDVSEIVLEQLRTRIRKALLVDQLGEVNGPKMTATEVLERSAEMARILGATFGRLQSELLTPLISRAVEILVRRGEIPDMAIDGRTIDVEFRSPQARHQAQQHAQNTLLWLDTVRALGPEAATAVDQAAAARWLARALGVPGELVREPDALDASGAPDESATQPGLSPADGGIDPLAALGLVGGPPPAQGPGGPDAIG